MGELAKPALPITGERRQVTALFYDIVDSTLLLHLIDPEDFADLQRQVHREAAAAVRAHGGSVDRLFGDGGRAYFGFPVASEDAVACAVQAGLELVARCEAFGQRPGPAAGLRLRVGIATGTVVIPDAADPALAGLEDVVGVTPVLAARIQSEAAPNTVVVAETTYRLTRRAFTYEALGMRVLKGFAEPVALWRAIARQAGLHRFGASPENWTPLVGRADELEACRRRWMRAHAGIGQFVILTGEAGIGKSRLVAELTAEFTSSADVRRFQCLPRGNSRPLHPVVDHLRRVGRSEDPRPTPLDPLEIRAVLDAEGLRISEKGERVLAGLCGYEDDGAVFASAPDRADDMHSDAIEAVFEIFTGWARRKPQLIVFEDAHWADPLTRAFLSEVPDRISACPILLIATRREGGSERQDDPNVLSINLPRLDGEEVEKLLQAVWREKLPDGMASFIHFKSDGIPLFAEELAALLLEAPQNDEVSAKSWERELRQRQVVNLQDLLSARLAALGHGRLLAQAASVIGREFSHELLARMIPEEQPSRLQSELARLEESGVLRARGVPGSRAYRFRHVLLQDAAYGSLLKGDRRELHGRLLDLVEAGLAPAYPDEAMAWHAEQAERPLDAARYGVRAAQVCAHGAAVADAQQLLTTAEANLDRCPAGHERNAILLQLLAVRGPLAIATAGKGSSQARAVYEQGVALCKIAAAAERERWFPLYWGWWFTSPDRATKRLRSQVLIHDLETADDPEVRLQALHCAWAANFHAGQHGHCLECIDRGLKLYDPKRAIASRVTYGGHDAKVCGLVERGLLRWLLGDVGGADESMAEAIAWADETEHPGSICHALDNAVLLACQTRDLPKVRELGSRLRSFAEVHGLPDVLAKSRIFLGWTQALEGQLEEGLLQFESGLREQQAVGGDEDLPFYRSLRAELLALSGRGDEASALLSSAIVEAEESLNVVWLPELYRQRGALRAAAGAMEEGLADLRVAGQIADRQGAWGLLARARADLARLTGGPA